MRSCINSRFVLYLALLTLAFSAVQFSSYFQDVPSYHHAIIITSLVVIAVGFVSTSTPHPQAKLRFPWLVIPLLLAAIWGFVKASFGFMDVGSVLFHLRYGVETGSSPLNMLGDEFLLVLITIPTALAIFVLVSRHPRMARFDRLACVPLLVLNPLTLSVVAASGLFAGPVENLRQHYVEPSLAKKVSASRPNILHIYLESAERTYTDTKLFGATMDSLLPFEKRAISATNIMQVQQTQWTIAGMMASQCGVPLIQPWLDKTNTVDKSVAFMPKAFCLSDHLKGHGYSTNYLMGVPLGFAGTGTMLASHNVDWIKGYQHLKTTQPDAETNIWGVSDQYVFDGAYDRISTIDPAQPWLMTIVTMGGHRPNGYTSKVCRDGAIELKTSKPILQGLECTNQLTGRFLKRLAAEKKLDNTIIIIQSDHLAMRNPLSRRLNKKDRRNFFLALRAGIQPVVVDRPASMMDVYPTLLELAGFRLRDHKAGLGVSLLSNQPTLVQNLGLENLNRAILYDVELRNHLWQPQHMAAHNVLH